MASGAGRPPWGTGVREVCTARVRMCVSAQECVYVGVSVSNGAINWPPRSIMRVPGLAPLGLQYTHTHADLNEWECTRACTHTHAQKLHKQMYLSMKTLNKPMRCCSAQFPSPLQSNTHYCIDSLSPYIKTTHFLKTAVKLDRKLSFRKVFVVFMATRVAAVKTASPSVEGKHFKRVYRFQSVIRDTCCFKGTATKNSIKQ